MLSNRYVAVNRSYPLPEAIQGVPRSFTLRDFTQVQFKTLIDICIFVKNNLITVYYQRFFS